MESNVEPFAKEVFAHRRKRIMEKLGPAVAVFPAAMRDILVWRCMCIVMSVCVEYLVEIYLLLQSGAVVVKSGDGFLRVMEQCL